MNITGSGNPWLRISRYQGIFEAKHLENTAATGPGFQTILFCKEGIITEICHFHCKTIKCSLRVQRITTVVREMHKNKRRNAGEITK